MIKVNNKTVSRMYFQNGGTPADTSLPVEIKRAYYNNDIVFETAKPLNRIYGITTSSKIPTLITGQTASLSSLTEYYFDLADIVLTSLRFNVKDGITSCNVEYYDDTLTTMQYCFAQMNLLESVSLSYCNTSNVTSFERTFQNCKSLKELDLSKNNLSNVNRTMNMFENCSALEYVNFGTLIPNNISVNTRMFYGCSKLQKITCTEEFYNWCEANKSSLGLTYFIKIVWDII